MKLRPKKPGIDEVDITLRDVWELLQRLEQQQRELVVDMRRLAVAVAEHKS